jgi:hypothetical protein
MRENAPLRTARDADTETLRAAAPVPFRITALQRVKYGSKTAEFSVETPVGVFEADLFTPQGREPFVQARSVRDKFSGQWRRTVAFDRNFAARILDALRTEAPKPQESCAEVKLHSAEPSKTLPESERRFDLAFETLDAGTGAT